MIGRKRSQRGYSSVARRYHAAFVEFAGESDDEDGISRPILAMRPFSREYVVGQATHQVTPSTAPKTPGHGEQHGEESIIS